jgi:hypothetical protein
MEEPARELGPGKETMMIKPNSPFPEFIVRSLDTTRSFYLNNLGFEVAVENVWYLHLVSERGVQIGFMLPNQPTQPAIFHPSYSGDGDVIVQYGEVTA